MIQSNRKDSKVYPSLTVGAELMDDRGWVVGPQRGQPEVIEALRSLMPWSTTWNISFS